MTGTTSLWNNSGDLIVGQMGAGTLTLDKGAIGLSKTVDIGQQANSTGTMTITGPTAAWKAGSSVTVGDSGTGTLLLQAGATLTSGSDGSNENLSGVIAAQAGSTGTVTVDGSGSLWQQSANFQVGGGGTATLTISNGGVINNIDATVADSQGSVGNVTVTGASSQWNNTGDLVIGSGGTGTLQILNGGKVASFTSSIGDQDNSGNAGAGTVTVTGSGSLWSLTSTLTIGDNGTGTLNIQNGAVVDSGDGSLGGESTGQGTVLVDAAQWNLASNSLNIGDSGKGTLTIQNGGQVASFDGSIGSELGSSGTAKVLASSQWNMTGPLTIGEKGTGNLEIAGTVSDLSAAIGGTATGIGLVTVDAGGVWNNTNEMTVGDQGQGALTIAAGGQVNVTLPGFGVDVAAQAGSTGTVIVDGKWNMIQDLSIGSGGTGALTIENGGAVTSGDGHIGEHPSSNGTVTVAGVGPGGPSTWGVAGTLSVGEGGTGVLNITNGGQVFSQDGAVGVLASSNGTVNVSGTGSMWSATLSGGTGTINVGGNGSLGTLNVQNGAVLAAKTVFVNPGGSVTGTGGTFSTNVVNAGGFITPGDATGIMHVNGNYTQNSGTTLFEIDGGNSGQFDQLLVSGTATFKGGILDIQFGNGFEPTTGENFDLITALALNNLGVTVNILGLPSGFVFTDNFSSTGFNLFTNQSPLGPPPPVPEPSTWLLMATGLGLLMLGRSWRKRAVSSRQGRIAATAGE